MSVNSIQIRLSRPTKKIEMARQLKSASLVANKLRNEGKLNTVEGIMMLTERISILLNGDHFDQSLQANITSLCQHLKLYGCHLEVLFKDQLDRAFVTFRNACQDERLDYVSRVHLLQLIELRANQWLGTDHMSHYYSMHVAEAPAICQENIVTVASAALLAPGEIIRPSGKFSKPTRIPGKNYCKDEVVIRNADSGKVMGIKGRRVHMIEELSETIISFQRVAPGAKERLVQITGSSEESITHAKQLIEDTIRRNASPVRSTLPAAESASSLSSSGEEEASFSVAQNAAAASGDAALGEYKYTVSVGGRSLRVTGSDLELVRTAKLVLDEYFSGFSEAERFVSAGDLWATPWDEGGGNPEPRLTYDFANLVRASADPLSRKQPDDWDRICKDFPNIVRKVPEIFDFEAYLLKSVTAEHKTVLDINDLTSSSPELE